MSDGNTIRDMSHASSCGPVHSRHISYALESSPEPTDPRFFDPTTPEYNHQEAFMATLDGSQSPRHSDTGSLVNGWSQADHVVFGSSEKLFTSVPLFVRPSHISGHSRSTSLQSQPETFSPMKEPYSSHSTTPTYLNIDPIFALEDMITSPPPMVPAPLATPPVTTALLSHDCTQFAFQTLNSLYTPPASKPYLSDLNCTSDHRSYLDIMLSTNKAAVEKLFVLLECPCSFNPHFSTTITVAVLKILSLYKTITGTDESETRNNTHMGIFTHNPIPSRRPPIQDSIRAQTILGELRKVERLIDKFSERYCHATTYADRESEGSVYSALEQQLRTQVRSTFRATMKTAPEDIRRQVASRSSQNRTRVNTV